MEKVGITSSQREAYVPGVSDFLSEYVTPFGYDGMIDGKSASKVKQTLQNIKRGRKQSIEEMAPEYKGIDPSRPRQDSWNLYLGKPQKSNTFRIAETAPINHPAYKPEQLSKIAIY